MFFNKHTHKYVAKNIKTPKLSIKNKFLFKFKPDIQITWVHHKFLTFMFTYT